MISLKAIMADLSITGFKRLLLDFLLSICKSYKKMACLSLLDLNQTRFLRMISKKFLFERLSTFVPGLFKAQAGIY